jgi:hypothetical protein
MLAWCNDRRKICKGLAFTLTNSNLKIIGKLSKIKKMMKIHNGMKKFEIRVLLRIAGLRVSEILSLFSDFFTTKRLCGFILKE